MAACRRYGFSPRATHSATSIASQLAMVACGLGITLAPNSSAAQHERGVVYRALTRKVELVELSLLWRRDDPEPLLAAFVDACRPTGSEPEDSDPDDAAVGHTGDRAEIRLSHQLGRHRRKAHEGVEVGRG